MKEKSIVQKDLELRLKYIKIMPLFGLIILELIGITLLILLIKFGIVCLVALIPIFIGLLLIPIRQYGIKIINKSIREIKDKQ